MADTLVRPVGPVAVPTVSGTVGSAVPASTVRTLKHIRILNTTGTKVNVKVGIGGTATANLIVNVDVPPGGVYSDTGGDVMVATEQLHALAGASGCVISVSAVETV